MFSQITRANSDFNTLSSQSNGEQRVQATIPFRGSGRASRVYRERVHLPIFHISPSPIAVDPTISCMWGCPGRRRDKLKRGSSGEEISPGGAPTNQSQSEWGSPGEAGERRGRAGVWCLLTYSVRAKHIRHENDSSLARRSAYSLLHSISHSFRSDLFPSPRLPSIKSGSARWGGSPLLRSNK